MDAVNSNAGMAVARDLGVQKLRDLTIAVVVAAAAGVGVIAWISAETVPGFADSTGPTGNAATGLDNPFISSTGDRFNQAPSGRSQRGPGMAVSGGS